MKLGGFELMEALPDLKEPHALVTLQPWVDAGSVGSLTLSRLEALFGAKELGKLARPGNFFDFTRYRPIIYLKEGGREVLIPNSVVTYAKHQMRNDFIFLHLLEPHMLGEVYVDSVLLVLQRLGVKRYCLLGSMYDFVPHTKPLLVTGGARGKSAEEDLEKAGVQPSDYQGPTTIIYLVSQRASRLGIETMSLIVHLPQYVQLDENYIGLVRLMDVLNSLYGVPVDDIDISRAEQQRQQIDREMGRDPELKSIVAQLETLYEARLARTKEVEMPRLSSEVEMFLREMEKRFRQR